MLKRFGHYQLVQQLAQGRCRVFEAEETTTGRRVVVKIFANAAEAPAALRDQLRRDMSRAALLREPHLVPIEAWGEIDGQLYLQTPFIDGINLQAMLDRDGPTSPKHAVEIVGQIAAALDTAHRVHLVHSGVAPENILVTSTWAAHLLGFGYRDFLRALHAQGDVLDFDPGLSRAIVGYAPEQLAGGAGTQRGDTHGLACVLYACLTGVQPYRGRSSTEVITKMLNETAPPPSEFQPDIPHELDEVVARGMAKMPDYRYASPGELARAARDALESAGSREHAQFGRYRLLRMLPSRRFAIYEAQENTVNTAGVPHRVAVKIFDQGDAQDPTLIRVDREATTLARLLGPNPEPGLVLVDEVGEIDGRLYLRMPFVDGTDLETLLDRDGPLSPPRAVQIVSQLATVLDAADAAQVTLWYVVPDKIMVTPDDLAYLLCPPSLFDVRATDSEPDTSPHHFGYFAPELIESGCRTGSSARYALACILYACLTGAPPFVGSLEDQVQGHLLEDPPKPSKVKPGLQTAFDEVIARGMAKRPEDRYASAGDMAAAARAALTRLASHPPAQRTDEIPILRIPDCEACGRSVAEGSQTCVSERMCRNCLRRGLPNELMRRLHQQADAPLSVCGYTFLEQLDRGGPGPVFRARSQRSGEVCAVRIAPRATVAPDERDKARPLADLRRFRHGNIVALLEAIPVGEFLLVASEYCPGDTVEGLVRRLGPLTFRQAMTLILPCFDALSCAHAFARDEGSIGVMHRNITPASLLLTWSDTQPVSKLADFGFATAAPPDSSFTPRPQILEPARTPARDVDAWRMVACLFYLLTGRPPRRASAAAEDPADVVMNTMPVEFSPLPRDVPSRVGDIIDDALVDAPRIGVQHVDDLAAALREASHLR